MSASALKKELSAFQLFTLGFGSIIGVGWIILVGNWLTSAGALGAIVAFFIGGVGMAVIGLCYCEAASRYPVAGGEVAYCYAIFGVRAAFAAGWIVALSFTVGTAFEAIAVGWLISVIVPEISGPQLYSIWGEKIYAGQLAAGLVTMVLIAFINWWGVKMTSRLQEFITYGLLGTTLCCVVAAFYAGDVSNLKPLFVQTSSGAFVPGILSVLTMVPLFYLGFNVIPQALGEKSDRVSRFQISAAIVFAILGAVLFYVLVILMTAIVMPRNQLLGHDLAAYAAISEAFGSTTAGKLVLIAGLLGLLSSWNAIFFAATRLLLVLARIGTIPKPFEKLHPKHSTPQNTIILVATIGMSAAFLGPGALVPMVNALGMAMTLVFAMIAFGILKASPRHPGTGPFLSPRFARIIPVMGGGISICFFIAGMTHIYTSSTDFLPKEWIVLIIWLGLGVVFWRSVSESRREISDDMRASVLLPISRHMQQKNSK